MFISPENFELTQISSFALIICIGNLKKTIEISIKILIFKILGFYVYDTFVKIYNAVLDKVPKSESAELLAHHLIVCSFLFNLYR